MKIYVGVTNDEWFHYLARLQPDEVNFWRPRSQNEFHVLPVGAPFLFKLHAPNNYIVGGGLFLRHTFLPIELMWQAFGDRNGTPTFDALRSRILEHRNPDQLGRQVGCTILSQPFFFKRNEWIQIPSDWSSNIVTGKSYDSEMGEGSFLWNEVQLRLPSDDHENHLSRLQEAQNRYGNPTLVRPRLGQGGFRVLVTDAYNRRCAITGERTLPALEAAYIRPYGNDGPHSVNNGILLRSDWHHLFDAGYVTINPSYRIEVSRHIRQEFSNGRDYYAYEGKDLQIKPTETQDLPSIEYLDWHRSAKFRQ